MVEAAAPAACMTALRRRQQQLRQVASRVRQLLQRRCHHRLCRRHQPRRHAAVPRTWSAPPPTAPRSSFGRRRRSPRLLRTDVARGSGIRQVGTLTLPQATVRTMAWMTKMTRRTMKMTNCLKHCYYHLCVDFFACNYYYSCCFVAIFCREFAHIFCFCERRDFSLKFLILLCRCSIRSAILVKV